MVFSYHSLGELEYPFWLINESQLRNMVIRRKIGSNREFMAQGRGMVAE